MGMDVKPLAWAFMFIGERCIEGTRTFSTQGIDKSIFNLFKMYDKMGNKALYFESSGEKEVLSYNDSFGAGEDTEVSGMASVNTNGEIQIMIYNHHDDWDIVKDFQVELQIENCLLGEEIQINHYRIDKTHSNAYTEWVNQGKPNYPSKEQFDAIKSRDSLEKYEKVKTISFKDNKVTIEFNLPSHSISLLELSKA
jgi:xylan 1,4-beta-xylosidase